MRRQSRPRRIAIWTGIATSAFIAAAWVLSGWHYFGYGWIGSRDTQLLIESGRLVCDSLLVGPPQPWQGRAVHYRPSDFRASAPAWSLALEYESRPIFRFAIPLWLPFLLAAAPTVWLWYRGRLVPPGHCRTCRYDLTGITTTTCPECGTATKSEAAA